MLREIIPSSSVVRSPRQLPRQRGSRRRGLDRALDLNRLNTELLLYGVLFLLSMGMHMWQLGHMAMAHDESVVSYMSWKFFTGRGGFTCAGTPDATGKVAHPGQSDSYCYDPVYHGPTQYFLQFASFFLFGVSDASARLPMVLAGIALIPMCWLMRPLVGKRTALLGAVLLTCSPSLFYYSRYARHDALMVVWALFLVVGLFRWLQSGRTGELVLAAAGLSLAWATHELVFILGFIVFTFVAYRALWEYRRNWFYGAVGGAAIIGLAVVSATIMTSPVNGAADGAVYKRLQSVLGPALLLGGGGLLCLLLSPSWERTPVVLNRWGATWASRANVDPDRPRTLLGALPQAVWWAGAAFLIIFTLLFTNFFTYPTGFLDGWYRGLQYWLTQHDYARGGQPWFYYFMLLPIYELLALVFTLGGVAALVIKAAYGALTRPPKRHTASPLDGEDATDEQSNGEGQNGHAVIYEGGIPVHPQHVVEGLFIPFTLYWGVLSFIAYSWAGEKMPWLLIHIATPLTLFAAAIIAGLIGQVAWRAVKAHYGWAVPLVATTLLITILVAAYFLSGGDGTLQAVRSQTKALPALLVAALCIFGLWNWSEWLGSGTVLRIMALTLAGVLLLYGVRSLVLVVYEHPDTPVDPLIYTQTSPDIPVLAQRVQQMAIDQTRNSRTKDDPTGGNSMKVVIDNELAWPLQWYFRDFRSLNWTDMTTSPTLPTDAPVTLIHTPHLTDNLKAQLADTHAKVAEGVFNWWFPENGVLPDPRNPQAKVRAYKELRNDRWWQVIDWPFKPANWPGLSKFMLYREIPQKIEGREFQMYVRTDLAPIPGGVVPQAVAQVPSVPLTVINKFGMGSLNGPRSLAVDAQGNTYVADALNHRVVVYDAHGKQLRTFGGKGSQAGQFYEPSSVAFDPVGNVYVADTWNARVVKLRPDGSVIKTWGSGTDDFGDGKRATDTKGDAAQNQANPLNFYGPRNLVVIGNRLYLADTGNKRIVVTDLDGNYVEQFGTFGQNSGQLNEPIGLGKDAADNLYVGDTWNGRVQVFGRGADQHINPVPIKTFPVRGWSKDTYNDPFLVVTADGRTIVSVPERLELDVYGTDGKLVTRIKDPLITAPHGLAVNTLGQGFVVDGNATQGQIIEFKLP
ncbi:MAG: TIGR03663 family protein [Herpetosiphonaceae bacterium]|nr:TIGR03663 family protein [Herpetosiphonaceae bacterium]